MEEKVKKWVKTNGLTQKDCEININKKENDFIKALMCKDQCYNYLKNDMHDSYQQAIDKMTNMADELDLWHENLISQEPVLDNPEVLETFKSMADVYSNVGAEDTLLTEFMTAAMKINDRLELLESTEKELLMQTERLQEAKEFLSKTTRSMGRYDDNLRGFANVSHTIKETDCKNDDEIAEVGQPSVTHEVILELKNEYKQLKEEKAQLDDQLKKYNNLPPNIQMAKEQIEKAKEKLTNMEKEIQNKIELNKMMDNRLLKNDYSIASSKINYDIDANSSKISNSEHDDLPSFLR